MRERESALLQASIYIHSLTLPPPFLRTLCPSVCHEQAGKEHFDRTGSQRSPSCHSARAAGALPWIHRGRQPCDAICRKHHSAPRAASAALFRKPEKDPVDIGSPPGCLCDRSAVDTSRSAAAANRVSQPGGVGNRVRSRSKAHRLGWETEDKGCACPAKVRSTDDTLDAGAGGACVTGGAANYVAVTSFFQIPAADVAAALAADNVVAAAYFATIFFLARSWVTREVIDNAKSPQQQQQLQWQREIVGLDEPSTATKSFADIRPEMVVSLVGNRANTHTHTHT